ncbi:MAG: energy transducer TonB [Pseudomonadales bacterium]|nr:energy transducer TonB [Pseudomonadales bacterium]MBO6656004.1 energy transducer TonB [Pseudomonadales bacterium]MBO6703374.1 energy transducer TonB [Pseudomonadales bacterium]MBO7004481.1 energy transducer TonB [Pseudomonadales bacterium]
MAAVTPANLPPEVSPGDRLSFTLFLAIAIHAALILGVTFTYVTSKPSTHTMEVTLAQQRSKNRPDKADFLAQFNQTGSGTLEEKALMTSPTEAQFQDTEIRETSQEMPQEQTRKTIEQKQTVVTTTASSDKKVALDSEIADAKPLETEFENEKTLRTRALEIASLEARLDRQRQIYAKRPRIKRLTSLSTASSSDAFYLNSWRRKIESIGNLNYPEEARRNKLYGSLRLMVAILPDGSLKDVELLESSGHQVLDDAAIRIVRLAAPFAPFPDELRQSTDVLEIIRTWQFRKNSSLRSY